MFKIFNRPEATVSTFEELVALKQFFDGKKHNLVFENTEIFYAFYKELFEKCKVNNFFENLIFDNNRKINVKNVPVDDVSDENREELIKEHNVPVDEEYPTINFHMTSSAEEDGKFNVTIKVDKELQNYWDPKEDLPEPNENDIAMESDHFDGDDADIDETDVDDDPEI